VTTAKTVSIERFLRCALMLAFSFVVSWIAGSGKLGSIVHPRSQPWVIAAGILALALGVAELFRIDRKPAAPDPFSVYYAPVFALAVVCVYAGSSGLAPGSYNPAPELSAFRSAIAKRDKLIDAAEKGPLPARIEFDDDTYWATYNRLYDDPTAAEGKPVTIQGFIYRRKDFPAGTVLVARNLMWCCSADMGIVGLAAAGPGLGALADNEWVEVSGSLFAMDLDISGAGRTIRAPCIRVESVAPVERRASTTIFPSF
jgi:uncharacterized repeat protein (TIGR03943 family)